MPNFRLYENGYVNADLSDTDLAVIFKNLNLMRRDEVLDFSLVSGGDIAIELMREAQLLTGGSFRQFMEANYSGGGGPLAGLVKDIAHFINGKLSETSVITSINVEENKVKASNRSRGGKYIPSRRPGGNLSLLEDGYVIHDIDLYSLMAGISPTHVVRFFQLIGGGSYYGS